MIPITRALLESEVTSAKHILDRWNIALQELPMLDVPGTEEQLEQTLQQFIGEILLVAGKCENLAAVLRGER